MGKKNHIKPFFLPLGEKSLGRRQKPSTGTISWPKQWAIPSSFLEIIGEALNQTSGSKMVMLARQGARQPGPWCHPGSSDGVELPQLEEFQNAAQPSIFKLLKYLIDFPRYYVPNIAFRTSLLQIAKYPQRPYYLSITST